MFSRSETLVLSRSRISMNRNRELSAAHLAITGRINGVYARCFENRRVIRSLNVSVILSFTRLLSGAEMEYEVSKETRILFNLFSVQLRSLAT